MKRIKDTLSMIFDKYGLLAMLVIVTIMLSIFFSGCSRDKKSITCYYPLLGEKIGSYLSKEIEVDSNNKIVLLDEVKESLLEGPDSAPEDYKNPYNSIVKIAYVTLDNKLLVVNFDGDYYALTLAEKLAIKAGIAKSYSGFTFVEKIRFLQKGTQIVDEYGNTLEDLEIENIITDIEDAYGAKNIANYNLYFGTADGRLLAREERALEVQTTSSLAKELTSELINGPQIEGLLPTLPKQTKIRQLEIKDGICYVDFSKEFSTKHPGGEASETLTIYSVVNTLTELPDIEKVQFLIEGEKCETYQGYYEFSNPFVRDSQFIYVENDNKKENNNPDNIVKVLKDGEKYDPDENLANIAKEGEVVSPSEETLDELIKKDDKDKEKEKNNK